MTQTKEIVTKDDIKEVEAIQKTAEKALSIKTDKDVEKAAETLINLKVQYDTIEEKRKNYVQPAQETIARINADFKKLTSPRESLIKTIKDKVVEYACNRKKELKDKEKALQIETKERSLVLDADMNRAFCDIGELRFKKGYQYKITNKSKIPEQYWVIDEKAIQKDIKDSKGQIKIPGVKVVEESIDSVAIHPSK